jgi:hypothetical protein
VRARARGKVRVRVGWTEGCEGAGSRARVTIGAA